MATVAKPTSDELNALVERKREQLREAEDNLGIVSLRQSGKDELTDRAQEIRAEARAKVDEARAELAEAELAVTAAEREEAEKADQRDYKAEAKRRQSGYESAATFLDLVAELLRRRDALLEANEALDNFNLPRSVVVGTARGKDGAAASPLDTELLAAMPRRVRKNLRLDLRLNKRVTAEEAAQLADRARELAQGEAEGKGADHSDDAERLRAQREADRKQRQADRQQREAREREGWAQLEAQLIRESAEARDGRTGTRTAARGDD
jgi:hypothetical protein